jgi:hypothetical protein
LFIFVRFFVFTRLSKLFLPAHGIRCFLTLANKQSLPAKIEAKSK